jgi:hypothetical protein
MLLIHPPVAKPGEPPAGIAKLSGALHAHGVPHRVLDANLEGLLYLLEHPQAGSDTWTRRAIKNLPDHIISLRDIRTYQSFDRYMRAVKDVNRVLAVSSGDIDIIIGLADYQHLRLSPVRSADLITAAEHPEDNPFYPYFRKRLLEIIEHSKIQAVGFSLNYLSQALCTFAMIGYIKREFPGLTIVLGGGLVSSWMQRPGWKNVFSGLVDHITAGPGEQPLLDLLKISGTRQTHSTPNYDSLPLHDYLSPGFILPYSGASGCYWHKCSFCPETAEDNVYHPVSVQQTMNDLSALIERTKPTLIHLLDNAISPALLQALAANPPGVPWYGFARISRELLDIDYCMLLKRSGCVMLKIGLESGDQGVLDRMNKGIELSRASQALKNLHKAGIATYIYLLFGTPYETETEAWHTLDFVAEHRDAISFLNLAIFNMPLCGHAAGEFKTEQFYDGNLSLYTAFKHPKGWDRKLVRRFLEHEFKHHPAVSAILKKDPPIFTSNHAAFFEIQW